MTKKIIIMLSIMVLILSTFSFVFAEDQYIQLGAFSSEYNATKYSNYLTSIGFTDIQVIKVGDLYKVFLGPYSLEEAREVLKILKANGSSAFIKGESQLRVVTPIKNDKNDTKDEEVDPVEESTETVDDETDSTEASDTETEVDDNDTDATESDETETEVDDTSADSQTSDENESEDEKKEEVIKQVEKEFEETIDYKLFTITWSIVLTMLLLMIILVYRNR